MAAPWLQPTNARIRLRRTVFVLVVALTTAFVAWRVFAMLQVNGINALKLSVFVLFVILLTPLALSFWTAAIGFFVQFRGGDSFDLTRSVEAATVEPPLAGSAAAHAAFEATQAQANTDKRAAGNAARTAIVMPVFNEDPGRVCAGVYASYRSLEETGWLNSFDFFILSDTTDPDTWIREELAFAALRQQVSHADRLFYRNRRENSERKTGNIAEFCCTWGERYDYMIVFDADSIMTGTSLVNLVQLLEQNPAVGIIQAPPLPVNRRTLFGRLFQFAMHAYSRIFVTGLNFWQGGAGNYWGHNAIIRIKPFMEHCRLPKLPGKPPLGGSILSHDFIEAAFMRRAGWRVFLASELHGSYEELPSSLIGYAARDRRWCQGNLQHSRLLLTPGLHFVSRVHIWMGMMSYLSSPLWLLMMCLTTIEGIRETFSQHHYFGRAKSLFPAWEISVQHQAILLFALTMGLLLLPKAFSLILSLRDSACSARFGGRFKLIFSVLCETVASTLLAPNLALLQARFVVGTLLGRNVKWESQDRGESDTTVGEAFKRHWPATALGGIWTVLLLLAAPKLFWWFFPVLAGFLLAIPLSVWTSKAEWGEWSRQHKLFMIPEEIDPPPILQDLQSYQAASQSWNSALDGLAVVLEDSSIRELHFSLQTSSEPKDELHRHHLKGLELRVRQSGTQALTSNEKRDLLLDREAIADLCRHLSVKSHSSAA